LANEKITSGEIDYIRTECKQVNDFLPHDKINRNKFYLLIPKLKADFLHLTFKNTVEKMSCAIMLVGVKLSF